jgi:hypothetical protein
VFRWFERRKERHQWATTCSVEMRGFGGGRSNRAAGDLHYRKDGHWYLGASPSKKSVQRLCHAAASILGCSAGSLTSGQRRRCPTVLLGAQKDSASVRRVSPPKPTPRSIPWPSGFQSWAAPTRHWRGRRRVRAAELLARKCRSRVLSRRGVVLVVYVLEGSGSSAYSPYFVLPAQAQATVKALHELSGRAC